jgi:hypothetical protein
MTCPRCHQEGTPCCRELFETTQALTHAGHALMKLAELAEAWQAVAIELGCEDRRLSYSTVALVLEGRVRRRLEGKP